MFLKKKNEIKSTMYDVVVNFLKWVWKNNEIKFDWKLNKLYKTLIKKAKKDNLMPFESFIDKILIILLNNKNKSWFNIKKALLYLDTSNYPIYKKISFIDNTNFLKRILDWKYKKYDYIFEPIDVNKSIHNVKITKKLLEYEFKYTLVTDKIYSWFNWASSAFIQFAVMALISTIMTYVPILQWWTTPLYKVYSIGRLDQFLLATFWWLTYLKYWFNIISISTLIVAFAFIYWWVIIISWIIRFLFENRKKNLSRDIDLYFNEINYSYFSMIKIKNLELAPNK